MMRVTQLVRSVARRPREGRIQSSHVSFQERHTKAYLDFSQAIDHFGFKSQDAMLPVRAVAESTLRNLSSHLTGVLLGSVMFWYSNQFEERPRLESALVLNNSLHQLSKHGDVFQDYDINDYSFLGMGTFGAVQKCKCRRSGEEYAVKVVADDLDTREEVIRETLALRKIVSAGGHPNIVKYRDLYQRDGFYYIITELVRGKTLHDYLMVQPKHKRLSEEVAVQVMQQLSAALAFLHERSISHRDLKPSNIMIVVEKDSNLKNNHAAAVIKQVKLLDFGSSCSPGDEEKETALSLNFPSSGTRSYWSPEMLERQESSPALDAWALGCILYIMLTGVHPFDTKGNSSEDTIIERILAQENISFTEPVWATISIEAKQLITGLLAKDPVERFTVAAVLQHPFITRHNIIAVRATNNTKTNSIE